MIPVAKPRKFKWRKKTGKQVEVIDWNGDYLRVKNIDTGKFQTLHKRWIVDSYAETTPARDAIGLKKKVYGKDKCKCGKPKQRKSEMCQGCRPRGKVKTADKQCRCGNKMNYKSQQCRWCLIRDRKQGKSPTRIANLTVDSPGPTAEEAAFINNPPEGREHEADAIIKKYRDRIPKTRLPTALACEPLGKLALFGNACGTYKMINSDRRRGRS